MWKEQYSLSGNDVPELISFRRGAQEEAPPAELAEADEGLGDAQVGTKGRPENVQVFLRREAPEEHDLGTLREHAAQRAGVAHEGSPVGGGVRAHGDPPETAERPHAEARARREEPGPRSDHEDPRDTRRGLGEGLGVGQLAPEVEAAHETEDLPEGGAFRRPKPSSEGKGGPGAEEERRAPAGTVRRGDQEDAGRSFSSLHVTFSWRSHLGDSPSP
jgi:hypothetical protein